MRVLHVYTGNLFGGVETALVSIARWRHLCPEMEPTFALCYSGRLSQDLADTGVTVHVLGNANGHSELPTAAARQWLAEILETGDFDVMVAHQLMVHAVLGPVAKDRGVREFVWDHGITPPFWEWWANLVPPDGLLLNSAFLEEQTRHLFAGVPRKVVHCPVADDGPSGDEVRDHLRGELGASPDDVVILHASRMVEMKGHLDLLDALALLKDLAGWTCWVAGGPQRPQEESYFEELGRQTRGLGLADRVRFLGERRDVQCLLRAADVLCQPNREPESFGLSFIEAAHASIPTVTAALGGALEIFSPDHAGLFAPGDTASLAKILRTLVMSSEERERLGREGRAHALRMCDPRTNLHTLRRALEPDTK